MSVSLVSTPSKPKRVQSLGEEIANAVSHGAGTLAAIIGTPFLIDAAFRNGGSTAVAGACVFAVSAILLYLTSTVYHALPHGKTKELVEVFDHSAIYLLIAGTYTPFTLGVLRGSLGWTLFGIIWTLAILGVVMKMVRGVQNPLFSVGLYLVMGWLILIAARSLWLHLPRPGLLWLVAGGLAYTGGVAFYLMKRLPYGHLVWHLFVLAGTACHYFAILWYAAAKPA